MTKNPHGTSYLKSHPNLSSYIASSLLKHSHMALLIPLFSSKAFWGGFHSKKWDNGASDRLESSRGWDEPRLRARERHKTGAFANPTQCGAFAPGKKDASKQPSAIFAVQWTESRSDIEWHSIKSRRSKELTEPGRATQPSLEAPNILWWLSEAGKEDSSLEECQRRRQLPLAQNNTGPSAEYEEFQRVPRSCVCAALAVTFFMELFEGSTKPPGCAGDTERKLETLAKRH